jgi:hypothetical protein
MPATATGRGAQVVIDPGSDTEKAIRGSYATTLEANAAKVAADVAAGTVSDGNRPDGTTPTTMATDYAVQPMTTAAPIAATTLTTSGNTTIGGTLTVTGDARFNGKIGFNNTAPIAKPTVSGAKGSNAALGSLLTALAAYGLVIDTTGA